VNNVDANDLATSFLDLLQLPQEVPESRLGNNFIGRKDAHAVDLGSRLRLTGQMAPDNLVFLERHFESTAYPLDVDVDDGGEHGTENMGVDCELEFRQLPWALHIHKRSRVFG